MEIMKEFSIFFFLKPDDRLLKQKLFFSSFLNTNYIFSVKSLKDFKEKMLFLLLKEKTIQDTLKEVKNYDLEANNIYAVFVVYFNHNSQLMHHRIELNLLTVLKEENLEKIYKEFQIVLEGNKSFNIIETLNCFNEAEKKNIQILKDKKNENNRSNKQT
jgi:hypothetical protein